MPNAALARQPEQKLPDWLRQVPFTDIEAIDIWFRGGYKSTVITFAGIIQEVVRDPEITISIFSHTSSVAKAFLSQIKREFEGNADLKALFPEVLYADPARDSPSWSVDNGLIVRRQGNPKEATVEAHGLVVG